MTTEPSRPTEPTEDATVRPRCRCGRELREPGGGADQPTCIGCEQPEATCRCGPND